MKDTPAFSEIKTGSDGLVVCVVQDSRTHRVLMVAYQDEEAWNRTHDTGFVHFHSRSRDALWRKGETSGNSLSVSEVQIDCDSDAVLISATSAGPTCHTGAISCFGVADSTTPGSVTLGSAIDELAATVASRMGADPSTSYTAHLIEDGDLAARKVLEEAGELAFAAKDTAGGGDDQRVVEEASDLLYHMLALLAHQGVAPHRVAEELAARRR